MRTLTCLLLLTACSEQADMPPAECSGFENEPPQQEVSITIRNAGSDPLYLGSTGCGTGIDLLLEDASGRLSFGRDVSACNNNCEALQTKEPACPAAGCALPPAIFVAPGGSWTESWDGTQLEERTMPESCFLSPEYAPDGGCRQRIVSPPGIYTLTTFAWDAVACETCSCEPDAQGSCEVDGTGVTGESRSAGVEVSYPDENSVEIVFD